MNQHDQNDTPSLRQSLAATAAQLRPAVGFGLGVAVLAGVAIGAGLVAADLATAVDTIAGGPGTHCCIAPEIPEPVL